MMMMMMIILVVVMMMLRRPAPTIIANVETGGAPSAQSLPRSKSIIRLSRNHHLLLLLLLLALQVLLRVVFLRMVTAGGLERGML